MAAPVLTSSVDGRFRPRDNIRLAMLAWDTTPDTLSTIVQRKRASGNWEDVVTVGKYLPQRFLEYVPDGLRQYRVVRARRSNGIIVEEFSNEQTLPVGLNTSADAGFDPILGAPNAPVNYEMFEPVIDANGVHLRWSVPTVFVDVTYTAFTKSAFIYVLNYFFDPTVAVQSGGTVTISGGTQRFIVDAETPNMVGYKIRWKNGGIATIQSVTSTTTATVTPSQNISSGEFALVPTGTTFDLYRWDEGENWPRIGESTNSYDADHRVDWLNQELTGQEQFAWSLEHKTDVGGPVYGLADGVNNFYIRAVSGSTELFSPIISITV